MDLSHLPSNDLARLCSDAESVEAWEEFVRRFEKHVAVAVLRAARLWGAGSSNVLDDLVQDTFMRLCADRCRLLREFVSLDTDSIVGYLKKIAANVTHDHFRAEKSQKRGGQLRRAVREENELDFLPDERSGSAAEKAVLLAEIDSALVKLAPESVTERDRTIFWLYYRQGFSSREIALVASTGLSVKGIESSIHRTTVLLREMMSKCR